MKSFRKGAILLCLALLLGLTLVVGCDSNKGKTAAQKETVAEPAPDAILDNAQAPPEMADAVIVVDGVKLTKTELENDLKAKMNIIKSQVPANKLEQTRNEVRASIINHFIMKTLLSNEVNRLGIAASEKEITEATAKLKESLPPELTYEEFLKKNGLTKSQAKEEIRLSVRIEKLLKSRIAQDPKVTDKEINDFYRNNKDKFLVPESVQARHILVKTSDEDDARTLAEKKAKAEAIRKELQNGADFADVAAAKSDCPSAQAGGDLGVFTKGQMVKAFDEAAFSQKEKEIGPVVKTEYGYHIIQVLHREGPKAMPLNEEIKLRITGYLKNQKKEQAYEALLRKLKEKAKISVYSS
ncbi:MAG: peptidylprolyl isomerase [Syntrophales bacterium]|jgi:peptidyl-prolyl cis-trans isomerase C|nr:peptidylprolyl isomerase [Syntrophales bacterium]